MQLVETSLALEMTTAEVTSENKKRKRRKIEWGNASDGDIEWAKSLSEPQLVSNSNIFTLMWSWMYF